MLERVKHNFLNSKFVTRTLALSKVIVLPGFDRLPIYYVAKFFVVGIQKGLLATKASSMAFKFFMALFPTIIFLFSLIPYIPITNFKTELLNILEDILPRSGFEFVQDSLISLMVDQDGSLLSFGFIFALYLATNGIDSMLSAFEDSYNTTFKRGIIRQKLTSISLLFILTLLLVITISALIVAEYVVDYILADGGFAAISLSIGKWLIMGALVFFGISTIYYLGGNRKTKWRYFSAGSTLATFLVVAVSIGFGFYVDNFANYNKIYGSIGTIIVVMLWIYFNSLVLLIGFELNASIQQAGSLKDVEDKIENEVVIS